MIKEIDSELYIEFRDIATRYFGLYPNDENKSLIFSAMININLGIQDINRLIDKFENEHDYKETSRYYELVIKAYQILNAFDIIEKKFEVTKSGYNQLYGPENEKDGINRVEERQKIDYFRALRSLTTAHSLKTTRGAFKKFGIDAGTFLEDVRTKKNYRFSQHDVEGDIILEVRKKDDNSYDLLGNMEYRGVWIDRDIIEPVRIILSKLKLVNDKVMKLISEKENELRNKDIGNLKSINKKFVIDLKRAVIERYPYEIIRENYGNGQEKEFWEIQEIYDFVTWRHTFGDDRDLKLKELQNIKRKELLQYAKKVQNMNLDFEDNYNLSSGISREGIDGYADSKITSYLKRSKNYSDLEGIKRWEGNLSGASASNEVSDELWGCLKLNEMRSLLEEFFKIDWDTSLRELYWQYLVALFVRQRKLQLS